MPFALALSCCSTAFVLYTIEQKMHVAFLLRSRSQAQQGEPLKESQELPSFAFNLWCAPLWFVVLLGVV